MTYTRRPAGLSGSRASFLHDHRGAVAIIVALALPFLVLVIGGGADYARVLAARSKLQAALDSATLATYKHFAKDQSQTEAQLKPYFHRALMASLQQKFERQLEIVEEQLALDVRNNTLRAHVTANFPTTFMKLAGIDPVKIGTTSEVKAGATYTEVALVLDVTSSMSGSKIQELKRAATRFIETIYERVRNQEPDRFRVAIVPFTKHVNVGLGNRDASWIEVPQDRTVTDPATGDTKQIVWKGCVGSRTPPMNVKDEGYDDEKIPGVMNYARIKGEPEDSYDGYDFSGKGINHCPALAIVPLRSVKLHKDELLRMIDGLRAGNYSYHRGMTYIPSGLMWGWRVLSHNPPYTEGAGPDEIARKNVRKVIVLMTDGANTRGPEVNSPLYYFRDHHGNGAEHRNRANEITAEACRNIAETNPLTHTRNADIITVTFEVRDNGIKQLMRDCATIGSYDAQSGELADVFEQIAGSLMELHISR